MASVVSPVALVDIAAFIYKNTDPAVGPVSRLEAFVADVQTIAVSISVAFTDGNRVVGICEVLVLSVLVVNLFEAIISLLRYACSFIQQLKIGENKLLLQIPVFVSCSEFRAWSQVIESEILHNFLKHMDFM